MAEALDWVLAASTLVALSVVLIPLRRRSGHHSAQRGGATDQKMVQVMGFLLLGVLATLIWLRLGSVDVALAEAALGGGLLGAVLVCCAVGSRHSGGTSPRTRVRAGTTALAWICGTTLVLVLSAVWLRVDQTLPQWSSPVQERMPETGVEHGITAVLLTFRAYDTLLESAVLMMAGLAALTLKPASAPSRRTPATLNWMVRAAAPVLLLVALWLLFAGSTDSGGAFQSGAVLAAMLVLLHTGGVRLGVLDRWLPLLMVTGVAGFLCAAAAEPLLGGTWLSWDPAWAFAAILGVEVLLTAGIAAALYAIYLSLGLALPSSTSATGASPHPSSASPGEAS